MGFQPDCPKCGGPLRGSVSLHAVGVPLRTDSYDVNVAQTVDSEVTSVSCPQCGEIDHGHYYTGPGEPCPCLHCDPEGKVLSEG